MFFRWRIAPTVLVHVNMIRKPYVGMEASSKEVTFTTMYLVVSSWTRPLMYPHCNRSVFQLVCDDFQTMNWTRYCSIITFGSCMIWLCQFLFFSSIIQAPILEFNAATNTWGVWTMVCYIPNFFTVCNSRVLA